MQDTYLLTQGPRRESLFDTGAFQGFGASKTGGVTAGQTWITDHMKEWKDYLLAENDEEEDEVDQRLSALKRAQEKFHRDLEEVIRAIPDMVVQAEMDARICSPYVGKPRSKPACATEVTRDQRMKQRLCLRSPKGKNPDVVKPKPPTPSKKDKRFMRSEEKPEYTPLPRRSSL
ncbi:UNVERIFIED_CONTAM: hypothetical protein K2H54_003075 [Gekko kuhli]